MGWFMGWFTMKLTKFPLNELKTTMKAFLQASVNNRP